MVIGGFIHLQKKIYSIERRNPYRKAFATNRNILITIDRLFFCGLLFKNFFYFTFIYSREYFFPKIIPLPLAFAMR